MIKCLKHIIIGLVLLVPSVLLADSYAEYVKAERENYRNYVKKDQADFKAYRDQVNADYADMMSKRWEKHEVEPAIEQPKIPEPPTPVIVEPDVEYTSDPIPVKFITPVIKKKEVVPPKPFVSLPVVEDKPVVLPPAPVVEDEPVVLPPAPVVEDEPVVLPPAPVVEDEPVVLPPTPVVEDEPVVVPPTPVVEDEPVVVPPTPVAIEKKSFKFIYYGTECYVDLKSSHKFKLAGYSEEDVSKAWKTLSNSSYDIVITDCLELRDKLKLSDWGYISLVKKLTESFFGANQLNEARVMQMYILTQSGYKARIARSGELISILLPFDSELYDYKYISIDGLKYYVIEKDNLSGSFYIFNNNFPNEQSPTLVVANEPLLTEARTEARTLKSKKYLDAKVSVTVNKNLIDFYNDFPRNEGWGLYYDASLSEQAKAEIYPELRSVIEGKSTLEAANILLNFVQTAFAYKTDNEQFGEERPLFADETLYYPYCDCEDRSIIFSILVKDLIGVDMVLLYYTGHLASAINIEDATGDYIMVDGKKFLISDPTYIGAKIGMTMPKYKKSQVEVIRL